MTIVKQVNEDAKGMKDFINLPYSLYKEEKNWCPPLRLERKQFFSNKNPFMKHSQVAYFVAYQNDIPKGRVTAHIDENYNKYHHASQGFFGFYESTDDSEVAKELMFATENWVKSKGMNSIMGPFNFSTNNEIGFLIKGFEKPPVVMMPYTKKYYPEQLYELGYENKKELMAYWLDKKREIPKTFSRLALRISEKYGDTVKIRPLDRKRLNSDLKILLNIYNEAWSSNWGFVPMNVEEIDHVAQQLKAFADTNYMCILYKNDDPAACLLALPNINEALIHLKDGTLFPTGIFKFFSMKNKIKTLRLLIMGVKPEYQKLGFDFLLYNQFLKFVIDENIYTQLESSWILEDNVEMINILNNQNAEPYKRYVVLGKALA
ncbi:MAG: hypothetical protein HOK41_15780 [Nitrospina sp.]|nr:hypothetical protein [Nitrospina sp.]